MGKYQVSNFCGSNAQWRIDVSMNLVIIWVIDNHQPLFYCQHVCYLIPSSIKLILSVIIYIYMYIYILNLKEIKQLWILIILPNILHRERDHYDSITPFNTDYALSWGNELSPTGELINNSNPSCNDILHSIGDSGNQGEIEKSLKPS